jgi:hypothetical protein
VSNRYQVSNASFAYPIRHGLRARGPVMSDFDARHLDDAEGLARLAEVLNPTKAARAESRARGRRRAASGFASSKADPSARPVSVLQDA